MGNEGVALASIMVGAMLLFSGIALIPDGDAVSTPDVDVGAMLLTGDEVSELLGGDVLTGWSSTDTGDCWIGAFIDYYGRLEGEQIKVGCCVLVADGSLDGYWDLCSPTACPTDLGFGSVGEVTIRSYRDNHGTVESWLEIAVQDGPLLMRASFFPVNASNDIGPYISVAEAQFLRAMDAIPEDSGRGEGDATLIGMMEGSPVIEYDGGLTFTVLAASGEASSNMSFDIRPWDRGCNVAFSDHDIPMSGTGQCMVHSIQGPFPVNCTSNGSSVQASIFIGERSEISLTANEAPWVEQLLDEVISGGSWESMTIPAGQDEWEFDIEWEISDLSMPFIDDDDPLRRYLDRGMLMGSGVGLALNSYIQFLTGIMFEMTCSGVSGTDVITGTYANGNSILILLVADG